MTEAFLHYLWQFQQFDRTNLTSTQGESIIVLKTGLLNTDAGPDFSNARILINGIEWAGNIEVHCKSSDWYQHQHQTNPAYGTVILHIVWENDETILREDGTFIPTLELQAITDKNIFKKYQQLTDNQETIPCYSHFSKVSELAKIATLDKALTQRLRSKALGVYELLKENANDWEETTYQLLARNFGFKLNAEPFLSLSKKLPLKILRKQSDNLSQIEAMIFGISGLLPTDEGKTDEYSHFLTKEFDFLASKYQLHDKTINHCEWKFLRLRPANFPTIRLAQFAQLIKSQDSFFSLFTQNDSFESLEKRLRVKQSDYWREHYVFGKETHQSIAALGKGAAENIIINTVIPLLACYAQLNDTQELMDRAIHLLEKLPPEKNYISEIWEQLGLPIRNAFDSQASIELYNSFCTQKKCLSCAVGLELIQKL